MNRDQIQARDELLATGKLLLAKIAGAGLDWAKQDPGLADCAHDFITTLVIYLRAEVDMKDELLELVKAWRAQLARCEESFERAKTEIRRELLAVGGYATTKLNAAGHCHDYRLSDPGWSEGAAHVVMHPEAGERCHAIAMAHRDQAIAVGESIGAVRAYLAKATGRPIRDDAHPEELVFAIYKSRGALGEVR